MSLSLLDDSTTLEKVLLPPPLSPWWLTTRGRVKRESLDHFTPLVQSFHLPTFYEHSLLCLFYYFLPLRQFQSHLYPPCCSLKKLNAFQPQSLWFCCFFCLEPFTPIPRCDCTACSFISFQSYLIITSQRDPPSVLYLKFYAPLPSVLQTSFTFSSKYLPLDINAYSV